MSTIAQSAHRLTLATCRLVQPAPAPPTHPSAHPPLLSRYKNAQALNDVTLGDNRGEGKNGFPAAAGWDAATGLGTPNYAALAKAAMA